MMGMPDIDPAEEGGEAPCLAPLFEDPDPDDDREAIAPVPPDSSD
jgi:hypothetical protein